jgi:Tol biopolymer transport system component
VVWATTAAGERVSSHGGQILFVRAVTSSGGYLPAVYKINADGSGIQRLTDPTRTYATDPSWSPQGRRIVFVSFVNGSNQLRMMRSDGRQIHTVTRGSDIKTYPSWSPNGKWIAFADASDSESDIVLVRPNGSHQHDLTARASWATGDETAPTWSPDGSRIALLQRREDPPYGYRVGVMSVRHPNRHRFLADTQVLARPTWSPNGKWIGITTTGGAELIRSGGKGRPVLISSVPSSASPAWSPGGKRLVVVENTNGNDNTPFGTLWLVDSNGRAHQLTSSTSPAVVDSLPSWRPQHLSSTDSTARKRP